MSYTVYGAAGSGSVPVEAALTLIGAPFEVVEAVTWEGEAERDKVAAVNPMRQIPALVTPEGETITESAAILIWLAERHPEAALGPEPLSAEAHGKLGVNAVDKPYAFVGQTNLVPLTVTEFAPAALSFPVIFVGEGRQTEDRAGLRAEIG